MSIDIDTSSGAAVRLAGHLDGRSSAEVRQALYDHIADSPERDVVLDMSAVESIDATALRMLAACALRLDRVGRRVVLRGCSPTLRRMFATTGWRRLLVIEREVRPY